MGRGGGSILLNAYSSPSIPTRRSRAAMARAMARATGKVVDSAAAARAAGAIELTFRDGTADAQGRRRGRAPRAPEN